VDLSDVWETICDIAAKRRGLNKTLSHRLENDGHFDILGCAGEYALQRWLGVEAFARVTLPLLDKGVDFFWNGKSLGMRASYFWPNWRFMHLQSPAYRTWLPDVLVCGLLDDRAETRVVWLAGWSTGAQILAAPIRRNVYNPCHEISITRLQPMRLLSEYLADPSIFMLGPVLV